MPYAPLLLLTFLCRFQAVGPFFVFVRSTWILIVVHILPIIFGSHGAILLCCFSPLVLVYLDSAVSQLIQGSFAEMVHFAPQQSLHPYQALGGLVKYTDNTVSVDIHCQA